MEKTNKTQTSDVRRLAIRGSLLFIKKGVNTYFNKDNKKETTQLTISLADNPNIEDIRNIIKFTFKDAGKRFTPAFAKGESDNITLNSQFSILTKYEGHDYSDVVDFFIENDNKSYKADISIIVALKEGAMYPVAVKVFSLGEEYKTEITDDDFETSFDDLELPFN